MDKQIQTLESRPASEEELFYLRLAREEFGASLRRTEEVSKYLIGAVGAVVGLLFAGLQIKIAINPKLAITTPIIPLLLWGISLLFSVLVFFPLPYLHYQKAPYSIRKSFEKARIVKWILLLISTLSFAAGLILMAFQF